MTDLGIDLIRTTLLTALLISAPILISGLAIGLCISIFQTVTQIQEQTLTFVPKISGMILVAVILIPWIIDRMLQFTTMMMTPSIM